MSDKHPIVEAGDRIASKSASIVQEVTSPLQDINDQAVSALQSRVGEDVLDEFRVGEDSFERGLPMTIGFKMLITCISFVLFIVVEVLVLALFMTKDSLSATISDNIDKIVLSFFLIAILISILGVLFIIYLLVNFFSKKHDKARYCVLFKKHGLFLILIGFLLIALCVAYALMCFTEYHKAIVLATFIATLIAFIPIAIAWNIEEEERLKNFIDGFSKACSCMAFMGGAIALIFKSFIA